MSWQLPLTTRASDRVVRPMMELVWGGKLPSIGDFVWSERRSCLRDYLEQWLYMGMQQYRSLAQNEAWRDEFDRAPLWNFLIPGDRFGCFVVVGCISPSCDRIGRRYPFVVAYGLSRQGEVAFDHTIHRFPQLLLSTGGLLLKGVRRRLPSETLAVLLGEALAHWCSAHSQGVAGAGPAIGADSVIMDVLLDGHGSAQTNVPSPASEKDWFPWPDLVQRLGAEPTQSFWWTNPSGHGVLRAFTYKDELDAALLPWLFRSQ